MTADAINNFDPEDVKILEDEMGIAFPIHKYPPSTARTDSYAEFTARAVDLLSIEAIGLHACLQVRRHDRLPYDLDFAIDMLGSEEAARRVVEELFAAGCLVTPERNAELADEWDRLMYGSDAELPTELNEQKEPSRIRPPKVWPSYAARVWSGSRGAFTEHTAPPHGTPVVYFLFDEQDRLSYIGSTNGAFSRLREHDAKEWWRYRARECSSRDDAFWLEAAEVKRHRPRLNKDLTVNGRTRFVSDDNITNGLSL